MRKRFGLSLVIAVLLGIAATQAQAPAPSGAKRTVLLKDDLAAMPAMTAYVVEGELAPGAESGWHTHPGHDFTYARSGEATFEFEGKPSQTLKPGMALHNPPGLVHNVRNGSTTEPFKYSTVFILEPGKPLATPATAPAKK